MSDQLALVLAGSPADSKPPYAHKSKTSKGAAEAVDRVFKTKTFRKIMLALGAAGRPLSRAEICAATGILESTACARLADLRPTWIRAVDGACVSPSGRPCDGYELTPAGRAGLIEAQAVA